MAGKMDIALHDLPLMLRFIPADSRETWVQVGMGCKAEFGEDAFTAWDDWSQSGTGYKAADARSVWRSFRQGGVGFGTVVALAKQGGWVPEKRELSREDRQRFAAEQEARRASREAAVAADEARTATMQAQVARACQRVVAEHCGTAGRSEYLEHKGLPLSGALLVQRLVVIEVDDDAERCQVWVGDDAQRWLASVPRPRPVHLSMLVMKRGTLVVPICTPAGELVSLQAINGQGTKLFPKYGRKSGCMAWIGNPVLAETVAIAEGWATGASVAAATGWPVAVAFDCGQLLPVAQAVRALVPAAAVVVAGDGDYGTEADGKGNPGLDKAQAAAWEVGGVAVVPARPESGEPVNVDWSDVFLAEGAAAVADCMRLAVEQLQAFSESEGTLRNGEYPTDGLAAGEGESAALRKPVDGVEEPSSDWREKLRRNEKSGELLPELSNAYLILKNDPAWAGVLSFNEFADRIEKVEVPPWNGGAVGAWSDVDASKALVWLQVVYGLRLRTSAVADEAARMVAWDNRRHPVREYLEGLPAWDGVARLEWLMPRVFGAADSAYTRHIGKSLLVSAVARVFNPGCKVDEMVVLEGAQGLGKSTCIAELFGAAWYLETAEAPSNKDFYVAMQGNWVVEIGEMQSFSKADITQVKMTITRRDDKYRAPYDRHASSHPRQCVFVGTTNADCYLSDPSGARRFLPVKCTAADVQTVRRERVQLWAEALRLWRDGFRYWDYPKAEAEAEQEARYVEDPWEEAILRWVDGEAEASQYPPLTGRVRQDEVTILGLLRHALLMDMGRMGKPEQRRVADILRRMGWERAAQKRVPGTGERVRPYVRPVQRAAAA